MGDQVKKTRVALQIITQVRFLIDDTIQIIDRLFIIAASEIETGDLIIEHQYPVNIQVSSIILQHFLKEGNHLYSLVKCAVEEVQVELCCIQILIGQYPVIIIGFNQF